MSYVFTLLPTNTMESYSTTSSPSEQVVDAMPESLVEAVLSNLKSQ